FGLALLECLAGLAKELLGTSHSLLRLVAAPSQARGALPIGRLLGSDLRQHRAALLECVRTGERARLRPRLSLHHAVDHRPSYPSRAGSQPGGSGGRRVLKLTSRAQSSASSRIRRRRASSMARSSYCAVITDRFAGFGFMSGLLSAGAW